MRAYIQCLPVQHRGPEPHFTEHSISSQIPCNTTHNQSVLIAPIIATPDKMAKKAKARLLNVRLISMAMTGFFYTFKRPRTAPLMGMMKYDPIVRKKVLFLETKKRSK